MQPTVPWGVQMLPPGMPQNVGVGVAPMGMPVNMNLAMSPMVAAGGAVMNPRLFTMAPQPRMDQRPQPWEFSGMPQAAPMIVGNPAMVATGYEPIETRNVMVNYVPPEYTEGELKQLFEQAGAVEDAKLVWSREEKRHKGFGFVRFATSAAAQYSIQILNGLPVHSKRLKVHLACDRSGQHAPSAHRHLPGFGPGRVAQDQRPRHPHGHYQAQPQQLQQTTMHPVPINSVPMPTTFLIPSGQPTPGPGLAVAQTAQAAAAPSRNTAQSFAVPPVQAQGP